MPRPLKYILYIAAFFGSFILFVYWMFPMEAIKGRIVTSLEGFLGQGYAVRVEALDTYRITGARLKNVSIFQTSQGQEEVVWRADQLSARASLFSLLFGGPKISFDIKMAKARLEGDLRRAESGWFLDASFKNLDMSQVPWLKRFSGLDISSSVAGDVQINYDAKQPLRTVGKISMSFDKLFLKGGEMPLGEMGTFPLPDLSLASGDSILKAVIDKGAVQIESLRLKGEDSTIDLSGKIFMAPMVSRYRMNLQGKFQFSSKLWTTLDPVLPEKWLEELKKQKGGDDNFPLSVSGQLSAPQIYSGAVAIYPFKPF